jgi:hypothetical protein
MVERKVRGLNSDRFFAVVIRVAKGRPNWDVLLPIMGARDESPLISNAHNACRITVAYFGRKVCNIELLKALKGW